MTEYESATLVFMHAERRVNAFSLVQAQINLFSQDTTLFLSLIFGYLLVAYFVGANLTRIQVSILNALYAASTGYIILGLLVSQMMIMGLVTRWEEISGLNQGVAAEVGPYIIILTVMIQILIFVAPLYFMWSVRHPKSE